MSARRTYFRTTDGRQVPAVSVEEMREIDRVAVQRAGPTLLQMMEHAGMELAELAIEMLGVGWRSSRVVVLCGSGGNGAGGVCAARHLANRGIDVLVVTVRAPAQADGALGQQLMTLHESPAQLKGWSEAFDASMADLVIDAVIGYSLSGAPRAAQMGLIRAANGSGVPVLSLDVPSGVDANTGATPGTAVAATKTLTLALPKAGLRQESAGELWLADLGIPPGVYARAGLAFEPFLGGQARQRLEYPVG
jgi:NAD(P)H-hydrate epimerase